MTETSLPAHDAAHFAGSKLIAIILKLACQQRHGSNAWLSIMEPKASCIALATRWFRDDGVDLDAFKLINAHDSLMRQRASMQRVLALHS